MDVPQIEDALSRKVVGEFVSSDEPRIFHRGVAATTKDYCVPKGSNGVNLPADPLAAVRDLEGSVHDLCNMASILVSLLMEESVHERTSFAALHLQSMMEAYRASYQAAVEKAPHIAS